MQDFGKWVARKWTLAKKKWQEGDSEVLESGYSPEYLRQQWEDQVASQTKPLPRKPLPLIHEPPLSFYLGQSRNAGKKAVEDALRLKKAQDALSQCIREREEVLCNPNSDPIEAEQADRELPALRKRHRERKVELLRKEVALGVEGRESYRHLVSSKFLNLRMNARAKKIRLRDKLKSRKFERDRVERSLRRKQYNGETWLSTYNMAQSNFT